MEGPFVIGMDGQYHAVFMISFFTSFNSAAPSFVLTYSSTSYSLTYVALLHMYFPINLLSLCNFHWKSGRGSAIIYTFPNNSRGMIYSLFPKFLYTGSCVSFACDSSLPRPSAGSTLYRDSVPLNVSVYDSSKVLFINLISLSISFFLCNGVLGSFNARILSSRFR
ncbi:hypothetical protein D3C87_1235720 [compost metagenome]